MAYIKFVIMLIELKEDRIKGSGKSGNIVFI